MYLKTLHLHHFRLYKEAFFEFSPKVNVIRGPNARGKTSLLEAIYFLTTGRSFRTPHTNDLIRQGSNFFYLEAIFVKNGIEQRLSANYNGTMRKITHNSTVYSSSIPLLGLLQGAIIHPDDASIVKGSPARRRHLLDVQLAQVDPLYVHYLTRYERAMRQRNHLLRSKNMATIESWECEMANAAAYVIEQRAKLVLDLQEQGRELYNQICKGGEELSLHYKAYGTGDAIPENGEALKQMFVSQYQRHRPREIALGATLSGPHRDDVVIMLGGKEARSFASEGQQRSCLVALRLAEWKRMQTLAYEYPLMLVDDLGMSLDHSRRAHLIDFFGSLEQVFVTTTEQAGICDRDHIIEP